MTERGSPRSERLRLAAAVLRKSAEGFRPEIGLILGSGLGGLADEVSARAEIPYAEIPNFPVPATEGHGGRLILGSLEGRAVAVLQGRAHLYEGHAAWDLALPVRVIADLGVEALIVTNAAGGLNPAFAAGDLMVIDDHINFTGTNPLVGRDDEGLGPRFPDMSRAYDPALRDAALAASRAEGVAVHTGVYVGVLGPSYETPAEIEMLARWGADAVGMSTVTEVIAARHLGLRVLGISVITNALGRGARGAQPLAHAEVLAVGSEVGPRVARFVRRVLRTLPPRP